MYRLIRSAMFRLDAESAHEIASRAMRVTQATPLLRVIASRCRPPASAQRTVLGLVFPSPIGMAGGFDKNAVMVPFLAALGFGFIEVGTVTLLPQEGNPRPRLFRHPAERALVNRMGFNNDGADAVAKRLQIWSAAARPPLFVNVGKNKDVPVEGAAENYAACYEKVAPHADAAVLNVSSPNTPGLRDLQRPEQIERLLKAIPKAGPILIKIAPDLDDAQIEEICDVCVHLADGMICTNTTIEHPFEPGGLSGAPLMPKSTAVLRKVRLRVGPHYPLIGVGGIFTAGDVRAKLDAGADLVQLYTSFIYEGPALPSRLARELETMNDER
jgi:dihydroorotate dehydrogenase